MESEPEFICPACHTLKLHDAHFALCVDCDPEGNSINPKLCPGCLVPKKSCQGDFALCVNVCSGPLFDDFAYEQHT